MYTCSLRRLFCLPGGMTKSLICASLTPYAFRRSRERRRGQPVEQRAEIDDQEQPDSIKSFSPAKWLTGCICFHTVALLNKTKSKRGVEQEACA